MQNCKKIAAERIVEALKKVYDLDADAAELADTLEYPPDENMGDLAFPCFRYAKVLRNAPPKIAAALAVEIADATFTSVAPAGGYINFKIAPTYLKAHVLTAVEAEGDRYGASHMGDGKTVVLDYSSPNTSKPFHIGHLGTTVIGHSLKLLHEFAGYKCIGINHLGDWGTQNGKQIVAFKRWGDKATVEEKGIDGLVELYVKFHLSLIHI